MPNIGVYSQGEGLPQGATLCLHQFNGVDAEDPNLKDETDLQTITTLGTGVELDTGEKRFGSASITGSVDEQFLIFDGMGFNPGQNNKFTIDFWFRVDSTGVLSSHSFFSTSSAGGSLTVDIKEATASNFKVFFQNFGPTLFDNALGTTLFNTDQFYHCRVLSKGSTIELYMDGTLELTMDSEISASVFFKEWPTSFKLHTGVLSCHLDCFRWFQGGALNTEDFIPPSTELAIYNTPRHFPVFSRDSEGFDLNRKSSSDNILIKSDVSNSLLNEIAPTNLSETVWDNSLAGMTYDEIFADSVALSSPDIDIDFYGVTLESRNLICVKIFDTAQTRPIIGFSQGIHGDEIAFSHGIFKVIDHIMNNPDSDPVITHLQENFAIYFALTINADGMANQTRNNSNGVNINRNWPSHFVDAKDSDKGSAALSEIETQSFVDYMNAGNKVERVVTWLDLHGWTSRSTWGYLLEQKYYDPRTENAQRSCFLYSNTLISKRDYSSFGIVNDTPILIEYRSHHKPYLYSWVKDNARTDAFCGIIEYPETENVRTASTMFLDIFKGAVMGASDLIAGKLVGDVVTPTLPAPLNSNSLFTNFNTPENRPDFFSRTGLTLTHMSEAETGNFIRCVRPEGFSWPTVITRAAGLSLSNNSFAVIAGRTDAGITGVTRTEFEGSGTIGEGGTISPAAQRGAAAEGGGFIYFAGGWNSVYYDTIYRVAVPADDTVIGAWSLLGFTLQEGLQRHTMHYWNNKLIVVGGRTSTGYTDEVYSIDESVGTIVSIGNLSEPKGYHTSVIVGDEVFVFGGWDGVVSWNTIEKINLNTGAVTGLDDFTFARSEMASVLLSDDDTVLLFFGRSGSSHKDNVYEYIISTDTLTEVTYTSLDDDDDDNDDPFIPTSASLIGHTAHVTSEDLVMIVGGEYEDTTKSASVWEYDHTDKTLNERETPAKKWGYIRSNQVFNGVEGDNFYITVSARNVLPISETTSPYIRIVALIGPLSALQRSVRLGYTSPVASTNNKFQTYSLNFQLRAGETEFRIYYRQYSGGTTIDIAHLQVMKTPQGHVALPLTGKNQDILKYLHKPMNALGEYQRKTYTLSPLYGAQVEEDKTLISMLMQEDFDINEIKVKFSSTVTLGKEATSVITLSVKLDDVVQDFTVFNNIPLNYSRISSVYRSDCFIFEVVTSLNKVELLFNFYGDIKRYEILNSSLSILGYESEDSSVIINARTTAAQTGRLLDIASLPSPILIS